MKGESFTRERQGGKEVDEGEMLRKERWINGVTLKRIQEK